MPDDKPREIEDFGFASPKNWTEFAHLIDVIVQDRCAVVEQRLKEYTERYTGTPSEIVDAIATLDFTLSDYNSILPGGEFRILDVPVHPRVFLMYRWLVIENKRLRDGQ